MKARRSAAWLVRMRALAGVAVLLPACGGNARSSPTEPARAQAAPPAGDCEVRRSSPEPPAGAAAPSVVLLLPILPSGEGHSLLSEDGKLRALRAFVLPSATKRLLVLGERGLVAVEDSLAEYPELAARGELIDDEELGRHSLCFEPAVREPGTLDPDETPEGKGIAVASDGVRAAELALPDEVILTDSRRKDAPRTVNIGSHLSTPSLAFAGDRVVVVIGPSEFLLIDWVSGRVRKVKTGVEEDIDWMSTTITTADGDAATPGSGGPCRWRTSA